MRSSMMALPSWGGGSVHPPGLTATSAMASVGLDGASCANARAPVVRVVVIVRIATAHPVRFIAPPGLTGKAWDGDRLAHRLPVHQLVERFADVLDGNHFASGGRVLGR